MKRHSLLMTRLSMPSAAGGMPWLALALPAVYAVYVLRQCTRQTTVSVSLSPPDPLVRDTGRGGVAAEGGGEDTSGRVHERSQLIAGGGDTLAIPSAVLAASDEYVIARERIVSEAVPLERILPDLRGAMGSSGDNLRVGGRGLLETYLGATMRMFTWTPQAYVMKAMVSRLPLGGAYADTFSAPYLDACRFETSDRVCGVYVVRGRIRSGEDGRVERVLLNLSAPEGWSGPVVSGVLDCGFVVEGDVGERSVRFVNEVVLWRGLDERPTLLEGTVSRWLHSLMIRWMMVRGIEAVTGINAKKNKAI